MIETIFYTFLVGVIGTGIGGILGSLVGNRSEKSMSLLLSFSGGIMISIVCFDLILESIELSNIYFASIISIIGVVIVMLLNAIIDKQTSNQSISIIDSKNMVKYRLLKSGIIMVIVIGLHNFPEGLAVGSTLGFDPKMGLFLSIMIAFHNIPEGMAISAPLIGGGMKASKAIFLTALSGAPTIIGAILGYLVGSSSNIGVALSLAFASGAMLYVVFYEIIPQSIVMNKSKLSSLFILIGMLVGLLAINLA